MTAPFSPETARRLGQLVRLLGSDKPGEVVAAAQALGRTLQSAGLDWHDLADRLTLPAPRMPEPEPEPIDPAWNPRLACEWLLTWAALSDWEHNFVRSIRALLLSGRALSTKQRDVLRRIALREMP